MQLLHHPSFSLALLSVTLVEAFQPYQFDQYDPAYVSALRKRLDSFHERLSKGIPPEDNYANDTHWNFDGTLVISSDAWGEALNAVAGPNGFWGNLNVPDYYQLVDGNICGTLFNLQGNQTGEYMGLPVQEGAHFNIHGAELWVFDENLEVDQLITVQERGRVRAQFAGEAPIPPPIPRGSETVPNEQTPQQYRDATRAAMISLHKNVLAGRPEANARLATSNVIVDEVGVITHGPQAFVDAIAASNLGDGAFPVKQIHDEYIIADGRLGLIEYIWHAQQSKEYMGRAPDNKTVRGRGMLWFEFDPEGLVEKMTSVYDERIILEQLESSGTFYLYP